MIESDEWLILTRYHTVRGDFRLWRRPDRGGYTVDVDKAGVYTRAEAESIERIRRCPDGSRGDLAIRRSAVLARAVRVMPRDADIEDDDRLPSEENVNQDIVP